MSRHVMVAVVLLSACSILMINAKGSGSKTKVKPLSKNVQDLFTKEEEADFQTVKTLIETSYPHLGSKRSLTRAEIEPHYARMTDLFYRLVAFENANPKAAKHPLKNELLILISRMNQYKLLVK